MNIIGKYSSEFSYRDYLQNNTFQKNNKSDINRNSIPKNENNPEQNLAEKKNISIEEKPSNNTSNTNELNEKVDKAVKELKSRDREVRQHEMAHMSAAGGIAVSGASYEYKRGPDGKMYAVGGEVRISVSGVKGDPEATMQKAEQIKNAALAPSDPSSQDRSVAAKASQMASRARMELIKQNMDVVNNNSNDERSLSNNEKMGIEEYSKSQNGQNEEPDLDNQIDISI